MPTFTKLFGTLFAHAGTFGKQRDVQPARDWLLMLAFATLLALGGAGYGIVSFVQLRHVDTPGVVGSAGTSVTLDRSALQKTVARYRERTVRFEELRSNRGVVPSPRAVGAPPTEMSAAATTTTQRELIPNP